MQFKRTLVARCRCSRIEYVLLSSVVGRTSGALVRKRIARTGLVLLLSAVVLLGGMVPPAVQHAHPEGDRSHDHRVSAHERQGSGHHGRHSHPHPHPHRHSHSHRDKGGTPDPLHGPTQHLHISFFWLDISLPLDGDRDPQQKQDTQGTLSAMLVRLSDHEFVVASSPAGMQLLLGFPSIATALPDAAERPRPGSREEGVSSFPLCDSARGERSGVQLI